MNVNYYLERINYELVKFSRQFHEKKIFIHIPKAAGMTIRRSFKLAGRITTIDKKKLISSKYASSLNSYMKNIGDDPGYEHARYRDISEDVRKSHRAFAVIRNPWDRVVSRYYFAKQVIEIEKKYDKNKHDIDSFEHFLEERHKWGNKEYMWHRAIRGWYPCSDYVIDEEGNIAADILRFESLNNDLCKYFNIDSMSKSRNVTSARKNEKVDIYNSKTIQIVADWYKKDIELFGYDYKTGPTRNCLYDE